MSNIYFNCSEMEHYEKMQELLRSEGLASSLEGIYWLKIPTELLTQEQRDHLESCGPYMLALEALEEDDNLLFSLETLVRAKNILHCNCMGQASAKVLDYTIKNINFMLENAKKQYNAKQ